MKTIWKFELPLEPFPKVKMPMEAKILHLDVQLNKVCIWALVDPGAEPVERSFVLAPTGAPIHEDIDTLTYLGTVMMLDGRLVWHIFEEVSDTK